MSITMSEQRCAAHAKVLNTPIGQAVVFLDRNDEDALVIVVQVWVASIDAPHRAQVFADSDDQAAELFEAFDLNAFEELRANVGLGSYGD